jgi:hypothetical protein
MLMVGWNTLSNAEDLQCRSNDDSNVEPIISVIAATDREVLTILAISSAVSAARSVTHLAD